MNTPYYEFNLSKVRNNYKELKTNLKVDKLYYALKPNSEEKILKELKDLNASFEVASIGEYKKLKEIGVQTNDIICSLPVKSKQLIQALYNDGITYFVFDNLEEHNKLIKLAPNAKKILRVWINDLAPKTIEYGATVSEIVNWIEHKVIDKNNIDGITFYLSKNKDYKLLFLVLDRCATIFNIIGNKKILNIGGNYRLPSEVGIDFYNKLNKKIDEFKKKYECVVFAEPGRSIVKSSGKLFTRVIGTKQKNEYIYVYIDAGEPTGISYPPKNIRVDNKIRCNLRKYKFFDITCSHHLLFEKELDFIIEVDNILVFENFGSYSICKSSNFHGWDTPICMYKK